MKIIHTADIHLNSAMKAFDTAKRNLRKEEILSTFEKMVDYAKKEGVSAIILAGDTFDTSSVNSRTKNRVLHTFISNPEITFFYLFGNHDEDNFISSLESIPQNLFVFGDSWSSLKFGDVRISGASLNGGNNNVIHDSLSLNASEVNIVVMHGQVVGYKSNDEAEVISIPRLRDKNIDYLALGHYHTFSEGIIDARGKFAYSGCLEGRGFDETGEKGFVLLEIENKKVNTTFVPFAKRNLFEIKYEFNGSKSWYEMQDEIVSICKNHGENSIFKVEILGERQVDYDMDISALSYELNSFFFFAKVVDKTSLKISSDNFEADKSIRGEFIREVMASDLSDELKGKVIDCGLKALKGEL